MANPAWIVMPVVRGLEMTQAALADCLAQTGVDVRVLVVLQGAPSDLRQALEGWAEKEPRLYLWSHDPPLPSLSATWNAALRYVWAVGGTEALVVNNDVQLHPKTYVGLLGALNVGNLFVSAVGVTPQQFQKDAEHPLYWYDYAKYAVVEKGGPDFSCFLISREAHAKYPFDEAFVPAYAEDLDAHRRYMLGGDGARIFSVNLPYLHLASQTVALFTPEERAAFATQVEAGSRAHYRKKWGGGVNNETFLSPFNADEALMHKPGFCHVRTPDLQAHGCNGFSPVAEEQ